jgi:hypothetical protein
MTQHRLGQRQQAQDTLARLRQVVQGPRWAKHEQAQASWREAEALFQLPPEVPAGKD